MHVHFAPVELVEVLHSVLHRRLVWTDLAAALREQRPAPRIHPFGDLVVLFGGFPVCGLLGLDDSEMAKLTAAGVI